MNISIKELLYVFTITASVILIYCEHIEITSYLPSLYHFFIPMLVNPVTLLALPILKNNGIVWGTIVLFISALAIFWEATLFFNLIVTAFLVWIISGVILLLKKIFKDNHIEFFLKINVIYGVLVFGCVGFLILFITVLSEKHNTWVAYHLPVLKAMFPMALIPVFFFYSLKCYRGIMAYLDANQKNTMDEVISVIQK